MRSNEGWFSLEYIKKALGHKSTAMTKRYSRLSNLNASIVTDGLNKL